MEKKRKEILLRLRNILTALDEQETRRKTSRFCHEKPRETVVQPIKIYATASKPCSRKKVYPLVPLKKKCTCACPSPQQQQCARNIKSCEDRCSVRSKRKNPRIYLVHPTTSETTSCEISTQPRTCTRRYKSSSRFRRFLESRELRGGILHIGCDCCKTNGLQDQCPRFCCLNNPKCRERPPACYLNRFCCAKHQTGSKALKPIPTYSDFKDSNEMMDYINRELECLETIRRRDEELPLMCHPYACYEPTNCEKYSHKIYCVPVIPSSRCCSETKVINRPRIIYESQSDYCCIQPTELCVAYPSSHIERRCCECCSVTW